MSQEPQPANTSGQSDAPKRILCVGMCVVDFITLCEQFPVEDSDKRCIAGYWQRGGNASNNCTVLRQLGAQQVEFLGMLSETTAFEFLNEDARKRGIIIENCPRSAKEPPFSSVILNKATGSRTIIHSNPNFPILNYSDFRKLNLANYGWIHFEARNPEETIRMLKDIHAYNNAQSKADHITVSIDLEKMKPELLVLAELAHYVIIGKDLATYMGWKTMQEAVKALNKMIKPQPALKNRKPAIICPWSSEGSCCLDELERYAHFPAVRVREIVDSLGAGDTFCAATIYALYIHKTNLPTALQFANNVAGYKLGRRGYDDISKYQERPVHIEWPLERKECSCD